MNVFNSRLFRYFLHEAMAQMYRIKSIFMSYAYFIVSFGVFLVTFSYTSYCYYRANDPIKIIVFMSLMLPFLEGFYHTELRIKNGVFYSDLSFPISTFGKMIIYLFVTTIANVPMAIILIKIAKTTLRHLLYYSSLPQVNVSQTNLWQVIIVLPFVISSGIAISVFKKTKSKIFIITSVFMFLLCCKIVIESIIEFTNYNAAYWIFMSLLTSVGSVFLTSVVVNNNSLSFFIKEKNNS
ncbi:MAG: hypothetical protein JJW01_01810 [Alphaproteobacteria bacterium]|nr:hypothetical protein [Rickettsiales bacterium]